MLAFHNDKKIKATYLKRIRNHAKADEIIKGRYWENGKGCAVGCTIHSSQHASYETELGIPAKLAHLEDVVFENLTNGDAKAWPERFLKAIPVGADLQWVWADFAAWMMDDAEWGIAHKTEDAELKCLMLEVAQRYRARQTTGKKAEALADKLWAARAARDARDAWPAFVKASAEKLLEIMAAAPVTKS